MCRGRARFLILTATLLFLFTQASNSTQQRFNTFAKNGSSTGERIVDARMSSDYVMNERRFAYTISASTLVFVGTVLDVEYDWVNRMGVATVSFRIEELLCGSWQDDEIVVKVPDMSVPGVARYVNTVNPPRLDKGHLYFVLTTWDEILESWSTVHFGVYIYRNGIFAPGGDVGRLEIVDVVEFARSYCAENGHRIFAENADLIVRGTIVDYSSITGVRFRIHSVLRGQYDREFINAQWNLDVPIERPGALNNTRGWEHEYLLFLNKNEGLYILNGNVYSMVRISGGRLSSIVNTAIDLSLEEIKREVR